MYFEFLLHCMAAIPVILTCCLLYVGDEDFLERGIENAGNKKLMN